MTPTAIFVRFDWSWKIPVLMQTTAMSLQLSRPAQKCNITKELSIYNWSIQGRIKRLRGPRQVAAVKSTIFAQNQAKSKKRSHVLRSPIFCPKSSEDQINRSSRSSAGPGATAQFAHCLILLWVYTLLVVFLNSFPMRSN